MEQVLVVSASSRTKIAHMSNCHYVRRMPKEKRQQISKKTFDKEGYRFCKCCSPVIAKCRREGDTVKKYCKKYQLMLNYKDDVIYVVSRHDCWRLILDKDGRLNLYHKNTIGFRKSKKESNVQGYHLHKVKSKRIMELLKYIVSHDNYRDEYPCTENKNHIEAQADKKLSKKEIERRKKKKRGAEIIRVQALIEELGNMY